MISLIDIKKAIVMKLKFIEGVNIVANDVRSGFNKPAFFIQIMPLGPVGDDDIQEKTVNIYINYFSEEKTDLDNLKMADTLSNLFVTTLKVEDRVLTLYDKDFDTTDNVLQFMFTLRYTESTPVAIDEDIIEYEIMQELYMNI